MRFLIDECLSIKLVDLAFAAGHYAQHVARVGLAGAKDWQLIDYLIDNDLVLVTRNSIDFRGGGSGGPPGFH